MTNSHAAIEALKTQAELGEEEDYDGMSAERAAQLRFQRQQLKEKQDEFRRATLGVQGVQGQDKEGEGPATALVGGAKLEINIPKEELQVCPCLSPSLRFFDEGGVLRVSLSFTLYWWCLLHVEWCIRLTALVFFYHILQYH